VHDTGTAIFMHIGSGSHWMTSSPDAPPAVTAILVFNDLGDVALRLVVLWRVARYPNLRVCFAEGQIGWMPYVIERADQPLKKEIWSTDGNRLRTTEYVHAPVYGCFYDDLHGARGARSHRHEQITFETDYPHQDSTWPNTLQAVRKFRAVARGRRTRQSAAAQPRLTVVGR